MAQILHGKITIDIEQSDTQWETSQKITFLLFFNFNFYLIFLKSLAYFLKVIFKVY